MTFAPKPPHTLPHVEYAAIEAVHWSCLKEMRKSPLHYRHRELHPPEETPTMRLGRAGHTAILEPMQFLRDYALFDGPVRRGKAWEAFEALHADKTILKHDEYDPCVAMHDAVSEHPIASQFFARGRSEQAVTWIDPETGLACKARIDRLSEAEGFEGLIDVKTTGTIDSRLFGTLAARMGYYAQLAHYTMGLRVHGILVPPRIVAIEAKPPHDIAVFDIDGDTLEAGMQEVRELLAKVKECRERGAWPGRYAQEQPLHLPAWFFTDAEDAAGGALAGLDFAGVEA